MVGILATVAFGAIAGSASATRLSINDADRLATANGVLTLTASGLTTTCNVTLGLGLASSTTKTTGAPIGTVLLSGSGSTISGCSAAIRTVTVLNGIVLTYAGFTGTLPAIGSLLTRVASPTTTGFLILYSAGPACLYNANGILATFTRNTASGAITSVALSTPGTLTATSLIGTACPTGAKLIGNLVVLATQPVVTLI
jgi:hypothetical protein